MRKEEAKATGRVSAGSVKEVVYDFEFIEDYAGPEETSPHIRMIPWGQMSQDSLVHDDSDDDASSATGKWPLKPSQYSPIDHPLSLMVI